MEKKKCLEYEIEMIKLGRIDRYMRWKIIFKNYKLMIKIIKRILQDVNLNENEEIIGDYIVEGERGFYKAFDVYNGNSEVKFINVIRKCIYREIINKNIRREINHPHNKENMFN